MSEIDGSLEEVAARTAPWPPPRFALRLPAMGGTPEPAARLGAGKPRRLSVGGIALTVHADPMEVAAAWQASQAEADCTVFQTAAWIANFHRHVGLRRKARPAIVTGEDADGALLFILPLAIDEGRVVRRLTWLGAELCDYCAPLLAPGFAGSMTDARLVQLWRDAIDLLRAWRRFDVVDLPKMPETLGGRRNPLLALPAQLHPSGAHLAELGADWEIFHAAKRSSATRKRERKKLRQLQEHGEVRFIEVRDPRDVEQTLATLFAQKARWFAAMGIGNLFARPGYRDFFENVAADPGMRDIVHVTRLDVGSVTAAASLGLMFQSRYYLVLSSYQDGPLARYGPGRVHLHRLMECAIGRGMRQFDFTVGDEAYKREWSDCEIRLFDHLAAVTVLGWPAVALIATYRRAKRAFKQNPRLFEALGRARSLTRLWRRRTQGTAAGGEVSSGS